MGFGALRSLIRPASRILLSASHLSSATKTFSSTAAATTSLELRHQFGSLRPPWITPCSGFHSLTDTRYPKGRPVDKPRRKRASLKPQGLSKVTERMKNEPTDDEESEHETGSEKELDLPLNKLNLGPKKKLIVLCLGGLLVDRVHVRDKATVRGLCPDVVDGKFLVFNRPFCTEFLNFCFERFEVGLWSSAKEHNIDEVLTDITGGMRSKLLFEWGQEKCTNSGFGCLHKNVKPLFLKKLKDLWGKKYYKGKYTASNTLLIDDEPHTGLLNPPNTAIFPHPYKKHNPKDTFLGPNGELRKYLDGLADAKDVQSYVKDHPTGQPAITPLHPNWDYYAKILLSLRKEIRQC